MLIMELAFKSRFNKIVKMIWQSLRNNKILKLFYVVLKSYKNILKFVH